MKFDNSDFAKYADWSRQPQDLCTQSLFKSGNIIQPLIVHPITLLLFPLQFYIEKSDISERTRWPFWPFMLIKDWRALGTASDKLPKRNHKQIYNVKPFQSVLHTPNKTQSPFPSFPPPPKPWVGFKHSLNTLRAGVARSATGYCAVPSTGLTSRLSGVLWITLQSTCVLRASVTSHRQCLAEHKKRNSCLMRLKMEVWDSILQPNKSSPQA